MINRILFSDNGTLSEWTPELINYKSGSKTFSYVTGQDAIYIGSLYPFNHQYFKFGATVNLVAATMSIKYWDGNEFVDVANILDETNTFGQSGFITFTPDEDKLWCKENTEDITELDDIKIYNMYWLKITFNQNLTASTIISWIGQKFSDDDDLGAEYPLLTRSSMKAAFETGKTSWEEQHVRAAELLIKDLIESNVIDNRNQILVREKFKLAAVSKCAELAFAGFGDDYNDDKVNARNEYNSRRKMRIYLVDLDGDANLEPFEVRNRQGFLSR